MGWQNINGEQIYVQDKDNSCGPACAVTIIRLMEGRVYEGSYVRSAFGKAEGGTNITSDGRRDFDYTPSKNDIVGTVLNRYTKGSWRSLFNATYLQRYMNACKTSAPGVLHISWTHSHNGASWKDISDKGYGHWVVLKERTNGNYKILDPGGQVVNVADTNHTHYMVNYGQGWMYGSIDGIITSG